MPLAGWFADAEIVTAMAILLASWPAAIAARADQRDRAVPAIRMGHGGVCGCRAVPDGRGCCRSPLFAVSGQASERPSPRPIVVLTTRGDLMRLRRLVVGRFQYRPRHLLQLHATIAGTARMAARRGGSATSLVSVFGSRSFRCHWVAGGSRLCGAPIQGSLPRASRRPWSWRHYRSYHGR